MLATYQIFTHISWARQKNKTNNNRTTDDDSCLPAVRTRCDAGWSHPREIRRNERFTTQAYFYNDSPIDQIYLLDSNPQFPFNSIKEKWNWCSNFKYKTVHARGICVFQKSTKYIQSKLKTLKKLLILRVLTTKENFERSPAIVDSLPLIPINSTSVSILLCCCRFSLSSHKTFRIRTGKTSGWHWRSWEQHEFDSGS